MVIVMRGVYCRDGDVWCGVVSTCRGVVGYDVACARWYSDASKV